MAKINLKCRQTVPKVTKKARSTCDSDKAAERMRVMNSQEWRKLSKIKKIEQPLCEACLINGRYTPAQHVHHLDSYLNYQGELRQQKALDYSNLASLCQKCHNTYHRLCQNFGWTPRHSIEELAKILKSYKTTHEYEEKDTNR